ncbi:MAG: HflC protein [Sorangiineae bacterium NIC37A_2]|jgi:membrane protease subunit HflC|nr:MAG: HflC protein [Sorangiineae bacterium NIC37A_2]
MNRSSLVILIAALLWLGLDSFYVIGEGEQGIVTKFGEYRYSVTTPGPKWKVPFMETVHRMDKRILGSDTPPAEYLTLDKKRLVADPISRWRIKDPILFFKTVQHEVEAKARLGDIVNSELRREIASHNFGDIVGSKRQLLTDRVTEHARAPLAQLGIELLDVRIVRADLPAEVQESVFQRMRAERERMAKRYRSEGAEEAQKIMAETDKEKAIILAKAYEVAETTRGEGEAQSVQIYAQSYGKDPEFFAFLRTLEAYDAIDADTELVLSTKSELLSPLSK